MTPITPADLRHMRRRLRAAGRRSPHNRFQARRYEARLQFVRRMRANAIHAAYERAVYFDAYEAVCRGAVR